MTMAARQRDINDPDFFTDENLDEMGEEYGAVDPFENEAAGDDPDGGEEAEEEEGDEFFDGESDEPDEGPDDDDDPAPQLKDLASAKKSYAEARARMNQQEAELQRLRAEVESQKLDSFEDHYDDEHFQRLSGEDPREAFAYALQQGEIGDAQTAIARMQSDAAKLAGEAMLAQREGDQEAYWQLSNASENINAMAQASFLHLNNAISKSQQAPLVEAEQRRSIAMSEQAFDEHTGGDYTQRREQVLHILSERPHLITGHSPEEIHKGIWDAYLLAKSSSPAGVSVSDIDDQVKQAIERHMSETRRVKAEAADAAQGAGAGMSPPGGAGNISQEQKIHDEAFESARSTRLGARGFMDL